MALFGTETGLFLGGVTEQSNKNRALSVQEAQIGLEKTKLGIQIDNDQKTQASKMIEELVTLAADMKANYPGTSEEFYTSKAGESAAALLQTANGLAQQVNLPSIDYSARLEATPTPIDVAAVEAKAAITGVETKIASSGADQTKAKALGVGREKSDIRPFLYPDGTRRPVDLTDQVAVQKALAANAYPVSLGVQAGDINALTGISPKEVGAAREKISGLQVDMARLEDTLKAFQETPEAGGILGTIIETGGGLLAQIPLIGEDIAGLLPGDAEKVKEARTKARITVASMLETITKEESGRFTDTERRIANEALGALDVTASPPQIETALKTALSIMQDTMNRQVDKLLLASKADLSAPEGRTEFFDVLIKNGFTEEQSIDILARMTASRGIKF